MLVSVLAVGVACWLFGCGGDDGGGGSGNNPGNNGGGNADYVTIGGKKWMKKNLNVQTAESWCYGEGAEVYDYDYDNDNGGMKTLTSSEIQANCNKYGRLYTWSAAKSACPSGWHLPSGEEWDSLVSAIGGNPGAGTKLKSTNGWNDYNGAIGNGTDTYGFSALPGGLRHSGGYFLGAGGGGSWWAATEDIASDAYGRNMSCNYDYVYSFGDDKSYGRSVRCVGD
jgi:uncharacterized protein (TIGR02145 family)